MAAKDSVDYEKARDSARRLIGAGGSEPDLIAPRRDRALPPPCGEGRLGEAERGGGREAFSEGQRKITT
jgi:hypothetical protein